MNIANETINLGKYKSNVIQIIEYGFSEYQ